MERKKINRRSFIKGIQAISLLPLGNSLLSEGLKAQNKQYTLLSDVKRYPFFPKILKKGDTVAITAPASPSSPGQVASWVSAFKRQGIKIEIGDTVKNHNTKHKYFSASDEDRATEFMKFIQREDINGIMCARGGWGTLRILPLLNYDLIRKNPKMIIGFSDITALINVISYRCDFITFHGPVASSFNEFIYKSFKKVLLNETKESISIEAPNSKVIVEGKAKGPIVGGNLSVLNSLIGTPYEINTKNAILLIEEKAEEPYKIDRMLTQLRLAGKFDEVSAIIIGDLDKLDRKRNFFPGYSPTLREVFEHHFKEIGKPTLISFPFGHSNRNATIPIGVDAEFDTAKKILTFYNFNNN